jgi:hypothetical protein
MKLLRLVGSLVLLASILASASAAGPKDLVVVDFTHMRRDPGAEPQRSYEYSFGDWEGKKGVFQVEGKGAIVNLLGSKGGLGENNGLDFRKHTKAKISFIIGNRNQAESFTFSLADSDGTECSFDIPLKGLDKGALLYAIIDLARPAREDKPGKKPGLDLKKLKTWQLRGNYQALPLEILFEKIRATAD